MTRISVVQRSGDFMAYLNGDKRMWGCGRTVSEAIGDCIRSHTEVAGVEIDLHLEKNGATA